MLKLGILNLYFFIYFKSYLHLLHGIIVALTSVQLLQQLNEMRNENITTVVVVTVHADKHSFLDPVFFPTYGLLLLRPLLGIISDFPIHPPSLEKLIEDHGFK